MRLSPGSSPLGSFTLTRAELIAFAERWDPQDFHIDPVAAAAGRFGDVLASGVQTLAIFRRLSVLAAESDWAGWLHDDDGRVFEIRSEALVRCRTEPETP